MRGPFPVSKGAEQKWVDGLLQGDDATYRQVYQAFSPRLRTLLLRIHRDPDLVDDAIQHTFLAVFRHIGQFKGQSQLFTWMTRIGLNEAMSLARKQFRLHIPPAESEPFAPDPPSPEHEHAVRQEVQALRAAIAALPVEKRTALLLFEVEGLTIQEICDVTEEPRGTILSRLSRTRAELRQAMVQWQAKGSLQAVHARSAECPSNRDPS